MTTDQIARSAPDCAAWVLGTAVDGQKLQCLGRAHNLKCANCSPLEFYTYVFWIVDNYR